MASKSSERIEIVISATGEVKVETKGFSGDGCLEATRSIEEALGARTAERKTKEFYQEEEQARGRVRA